MSEPRIYYSDAFCTLWLGDCRDVLPGLEKGSIELVVTDPPYGINTKSDGNGKLSPWPDLCNSSLWYEWWIGQARRLLSWNGALWSFLNWRSLVTFQKASCDLCWPIESLLIWDKCWIGPGGNKGLRPSYEMVSLWAMPDFSIDNRGLADVQRFKWSSHKPNGHPAEKPINLISWLINESGGQSILDPFAGSGTTLRAAKDMGRKSIGIEINEAYCEISARRLEQGVLEYQEPPAPAVEQAGLWERE